MSALKSALHDGGRRFPTRPALISGSRSVGYADLDMRVRCLADHWFRLGLRSLALYADNGLPWAVADLAAHVAGLPLLPLPLFFSASQCLHALRDSGVEALLTDRPETARAWLAQGGIAPVAEIGSGGLVLLRLPIRMDTPARLPSGTAKVTYTSGTTGEPKGVCLSRQHLEQVATALHEATQASALDRHLCLTPLSTLLENVAGVHVPLLAGASCELPPLAEVGLGAPGRFDPRRMLAALHGARASSAILAPQMLQALVALLEAGASRPAGLRFVAVGGAPVSPRLLARAEAVGLPVYEGYGLSECGSVVALNRPGARRPGTVGRPLPHIGLRIDADGEVCVQGSGFLGYVGAGAPPDPWPTGDRGELDEDGFLRLRGRRKHLYITSYGRNLAPEWVESELTAEAAIAQAALFGDARPFNAALLVAAPGADDTALELAVARANARLPDYARVRRWSRATAPFTAENRHATSNGRLRRAEIAAAHADLIDSFYQEELHAVL